VGIQKSPGLGESVSEEGVFYPEGEREAGEFGAPDENLEQRFREF
jgi:hypothetical protein